MGPFVGLQGPHRPRGLTSTSSFLFWEPISRVAGGLGQGSLGCWLSLLTSFTLRGTRAVPGLNRAVGTSDLVHAGPLSTLSSPLRSQAL